MTQNLLYQLGDPALGVARTYISSNIKKGILFSNTHGYSNPEVDRLFEEAALALDEANRQELYCKVQQILVEDVPVAWPLELDFRPSTTSVQESRASGHRLERDLRLGLQIAMGTRSAALIAS